MKCCCLLLIRGTLGHWTVPQCALEQIWIQTEEKKVWIWVIFGQDYLLMWSQKLDLIASWVPPTCDIFIYLLFLCFRWKHPKYSFCFILRTQMDWCLVWKKYNRESVKKICPEIWVVLPPFFFTRVFAPPTNLLHPCCHLPHPHPPHLNRSQLRRGQARNQ